MHFHGSDKIWKTVRKFLFAYDSVSKTDIIAHGVSDTISDS